MIENARQRPLKISEEFGRHRTSSAWEDAHEHPPIIQIWIDSRRCIGFPFDKVTSLGFEGEGNRLTINVDKVGIFLIEGPKVLQFFESFCEHAASNLKADGKDILSVSFIPAE